MMKGIAKSRGLTVIELLLIIIVICILAAVIALTFNGVRAKDQNAERLKDIDATKSQLEAYYAATNTYPTAANLNDADWRGQNLKKLSASSIEDPSWTNQINACTSDNKPSLASQPTINCYSYQVTSTDGSTCDNNTAPCAHYTLTAILEGGENYVKTSLN